MNEHEQLIEKASQRLKELSEQAEEYGEHRLVPLSEQDVQLFNAVLDLAWRYVESEK